MGPGGGFYAAWAVAVFRRLSEDGGPVRRSCGGLPAALHEPERAQEARCAGHGDVGDACRAQALRAYRGVARRRSSSRASRHEPNRQRGCGAAGQVTIDNIEVAQFIYMLLHNEKIRDVITRLGRKACCCSGGSQKAGSRSLREELRKRGYLPIVFNFDKPETKDFTETVQLLAGLSKFVIADITNPKSAPLELQ